ncbi:hypothetical protein BDZ89DRAFT_362620 [Hymenopellis radicata]|nr:hypothetical protein BDZ89DRAFT_362620 [Hymenopellis radicata]
MWRWPLDTSHVLSTFFSRRHLSFSVGVHSHFMMCCLCISVGAFALLSSSYTSVPFASSSSSRTGGSVAILCCPGRRYRRDCSTCMLPYIIIISFFHPSSSFFVVRARSSRLQGFCPWVIPIRERFILLSSHRSQHGERDLQYL